MPRTIKSDLEKKEISEKIRNALKNSRLSQNKLHELTDIPIDTIKAYIKARRCPSLENAKKIAEITGTNYMIFLSSEQRKRLRTENRGTFIEKNKVYVSLIRSAGFRFDAVSDDNLEIKCNVSSKTLQPYNDDHAEIMQKLAEYRRGLHPEYTEDYLQDLLDSEACYTYKATPRIDLDTESWEMLKKEISSAVKDIIKKHIDAAVAEREKIQKEKIHQDTVSDLIKTINAVKTVLPVLSASGSVDGETLKTLQTLSKKYQIRVRR